MTGRGRPHKTKSTDLKGARSKTRPEETQQVPVSTPRCPDFTEEKQNETTKLLKPKKRQQEKPNHTEEKPPAQSTRKEKTMNHFTEDISKEQTMPTESTKVPVRGTKAKSCAARTTSTEQSAAKIKTTQPETPKDTANESPKITKGKKKPCRAKLPEECAEKMKTQPDTDKGTTKPKACGGKAKSAVQDSEEMTVQPGTPKNTAKASIKLTKAKARGDKAISQEESTEETTKTQSETPEDSTEDRSEGSVDSVLHTTLKNMKIKRNDRSNAAEVINEIIKNIVKHLKQKTQCFKDVEEPLRTGSYYENLKISHPDEFDVMLPIPVERVHIEPFGDDGAFYSVALKRDRNPLQQFQENSILSASKMLQEFRDEVKKCVKAFTEWEVTKKKKGCPAVTLITEVQSVPISLDVVLCLMVKSSWPPFTKEGLKIESWLGTKVKQDYKRKPYYLVPKYEGRGTVENDGVLAKDVWRVSFSHIEKAILKNHGSEKTCCERGGACCCRKDCLKLLKHLLSLLKERNSSFDKFCSYHAKTTLLHACCSRPRDSDWSASDLSRCFQLFLEDFESHLENGLLQNFFIPSQNLLSGPGKKVCKTLAECIKEERHKGFPIFKQ